MHRISHDPVSEELGQVELGQEQWFADLIGGMIRRSKGHADVYNYNRMLNIYEEECVECLVDVYESCREVENDI